MNKKALSIESNMKNLISIITSILLTAITLSPVYSSAVNVSDYKIPFVSVKADSADVDLNELALSLRADTDYFNFPNYTPNDSENQVSEEIISRFLRNLTLNEVYSGMDNVALDITGACYGMSVLQVLVHNGIISASDIQEGAETLNDIKFDSSVNDIIAYYSMTQDFFRQKFNSFAFFSRTPVPDKLQTLIQYAENAMKTGKYFQISYIIDDVGGHGVVGIGSADGSWTFNNRTYDKCILTLDSNSVDNNGNGGGFNRQTCIYINTYDNTFCIPAYDADESNMRIQNITDNENLLNYKGLISPALDSDETKSDVSFITVYNVSECDYDLSLTKNGTETIYHGNASGLDIPDYSLTSQLSSVLLLTSYCIENSDIYKIDVTDIDDDELDTHMQIYLRNENTDIKIAGDGKFSATIEPHKISVTNNVPVTDDNRNSPTGIGDVSFTLHSDDSPYKNSRFSLYDLWGRCNGTISMEEREDGILIRHDAPLDAKISFRGVKTLEDGSFTYQNQGREKNTISYEVYSTADNLWTYDNETNDLVIYADPDGDGIFDKKVEPGDVNCDGFIDATDASKILEIYANLSTDCPIAPHILKKRYSDFNNDGLVDAVDASGVLARYAELSTNN